MTFSTFFIVLPEIEFYLISVRDFICTELFRKFIYGETSWTGTHTEPQKRQPQLYQ